MKSNITFNILRFFVQNNVSHKKRDPQLILIPYSN